MERAFPRRRGCGTSLSSFYFSINRNFRNIVTAEAAPHGCIYRCFKTPCPNATLNRPRQDILSPGGRRVRN
jgi:hypothetical protein